MCQCGFGRQSVTSAENSVHGFGRFPLAGPGVATRAFTKTDNVSSNIRLRCLYLEVSSFLTLYFVIVTYVTVELALQ